VSDEIVETVIGAIGRVKKIAPESVSLDSTFEELKMDSLDGLDLLFELEEAFDLTIADERARSLRSVRGVVEEIRTLISERSRTLPAENG
jgi:acyl carrier protein